MSETVCHLTLVCSRRNLSCHDSCGAGSTPVKPAVGRKLLKGQAKKMRKIFIVLLVLFMSSVFIQSVLAQSYIGLYTDEEHSSPSANNLEGSCLFDLWVWILPGENGVMCAEYKLDLPENMIPQSAVLNPSNSIYMGEAYGSPGLSICFPECQNDWFWTAKIQILLTDRIAGYLVLSAHEDGGTMQIANCAWPDYTLESLTMLNGLSVNTALQPILTDLEMTGPSTLRAFFDRDLMEYGNIFSIEPAPENVAIFDKDNPPVSIEVLAVERVDGIEHSLDITLASTLDTQKSYILATTHLCAWGHHGGMCLYPICGDSEIEFAGTISTSSSSWGAIKRLIESSD